MTATAVPYPEELPASPRRLTQLRRRQIAESIGTDPDHPGVRAVHEAEKHAWWHLHQVRHEVDFEGRDDVDPFDVLGIQRKRAVR